MARRRKKLPREAVAASIQSLSHEGRGIAYIDDKITFIRGALPGEEILFRYTNQRAKFNEGITTEVLTASDQRVSAECHYYGVCGGCSLQHLDHPAQIQHKQSVLVEQLHTIGNAHAEDILPPLTGARFAYRRKARLGVKYVNKKEKLLIGFREVGSNFIAEIDQCEVLHPSIGKRISALQELISDLSIKDKIPQLEVAVGDENSVIIIRHLAAFTDDDLQQLKIFEDQHNIEFHLQSSGPDSIIKLSPDKNRLLQYTLSDHDIVIEFSANDFTQVNFDINRQMINRVISFLKLNKNDTVLDLFCGLGNFTLPIAKYCHHVTGIEGNSELVKRAYFNAQLNNLSNVTFIAMDLDQDNLAQQFSDKRFNKLLLDPARSGADKILHQLPLKNVETIVYVSCNPATLARDSAILIHEKGYKLINAGIMDMFPHTSHVESIAVFKQ